MSRNAQAIHIFRSLKRPTALGLFKSQYDPNDPNVSEIATGLSSKSFVRVPCPVRLRIKNLAFLGDLDDLMLRGFLSVLPNVDTIVFLESSPEFIKEVMPLASSARHFAFHRVVVPCPIRKSIKHYSVNTQDDAVKIGVARGFPADMIIRSISVHQCLSLRECGTKLFPTILAVDNASKGVSNWIRPELLTSLHLKGYSELSQLSNVESILRDHSLDRISLSTRTCSTQLLLNLVEHDPISLSIDGRILKDDPWLRPVHRCLNLRNLNLHNTTQLKHETLFRILEACPNIEILSLPTMTINHALISTLKTLPGLKELLLWNPRIPKYAYYNWELGEISVQVHHRLQISAQACLAHAHVMWPGANVELLN